MVSHIYYVKKASDPWTPVPMSERQPGVHKLYGQILFFKHFIDLTKPLVLCEGKTDSLYLRAAIRHLTSFHPALAASSGNKIEKKIKFFRYTQMADEILRLAGGTGDLSKLIANYDNHSRLYSKTPKFPVIVLIDNDSGASPIQKVVKNKFGKAIDLTSANAFYHLSRNLYLVKTPERGADGVSCIEDFFENQVLETKLGGKSFNSSNFQESATEYGKFVFAEKVVSPNAHHINFANFAPLLSRVVQATQHHTTQLL
jgi:hypothetical protein